MKKIAGHTVLLTGDSLESCCKQVRNYFERTTLVRYDTLEIIETRCIQGISSNFTATLEQAVSKNIQSIDNLILDLEKTGITKISEIKNLEQGYPSKIFHLLSHFMDGFISTDSAFYNLIDDSHQVPPATLQAIQNNQEKHWLIYVEGYSASPEEAALLPMHL